MKTETLSSSSPVVPILHKMGKSTKAIFKTAHDRDKTKFLQEFFTEYQYLQQNFPPFLLTPSTYFTYKDLQRCADVDTVHTLVKCFVATQHTPQIKSLSIRKGDVILSIRGDYDQHWFITLAQVMNRRLSCSRYTRVEFIQVNSVHIKPLSKVTNTYANRPRNLRRSRKVKSIYKK